MTRTKTTGAPVSRFGRMRVADYLAHQIELCGKTHKQIADEVGFSKPNIISMLKTGRTKVPLERAPALADALGVSRSYLIRLVMGEHHPELLSVMEEIFGYHVSDNEFSIVEFIREVTGYADPGLGSRELKDGIRKVFEDALPHLSRHS